MVIVSEDVTPLDDLNVALKIHYKTSAGEDRPVKEYKPSPGYFAGAPLYFLSTDLPNATIHIGQIVEVTLNIVVKRMMMYGSIHVCTFIDSTVTVDFS